uniref:Uncharacterized protein n=1 Tax=Setaria digitata TaxID=48799 RepID=A0A915PFH1_9BILA
MIVPHLLRSVTRTIYRSVNFSYLAFISAKKLQVQQLILQMHVAISIAITLVASTSGLSFLTDEWTQKFGKKLDNAQDFVQRSKDIFSTVARNLKSGGEKLKATVMETAETTLRGAGDEVEGFFSEVPNRVNDGFDELLAKLGEACSWVFRNIIAPILFIIILIGLLYIFIVSGCCGCCCSTLLSQFGISLGNTFKRLKKDEYLQNGDRIIVLRDFEASTAPQENELLNRQLLKDVRILKI